MQTYILCVYLSIDIQNWSMQQLGIDGFERKNQVPFLLPWEVRSGRGCTPVHCGPLLVKGRGEQMRNTYFFVRRLNTYYILVSSIVSGHQYSLAALSSTVYSSLCVEKHNSSTSNKPHHSSSNEHYPSSSIKPHPFSSSKKHLPSSSIKNPPTASYNPPLPLAGTAYSPQQNNPSELQDKTVLSSSVENSSDNLLSIRHHSGKAQVNGFPVK